MYVDTKREGEAQTKADPFSLESLIAWLGKQPATREYTWVDCRECLIGQYAQTLGYKDAGDIPSAAYEELEGISRNANCNNAVAFPLPHTFGAALERARKLLADKR